MKLTFIRKTALSGDTNCPSLYRTDEHAYLVVGPVVTDPAVLAQATAGIGEGEVAVLVPADVLDRGVCWPRGSSRAR